MDTTNICKLCNKEEAKYVCPRCNMPYCSLLCYQSQLHIQCSESFYRDCVVEEIKSDDVDPESQRNMMQILQRVQQIDEESDNEEIQDSDDDSDEGELAARLSGIDLDDADSVWDKLTADERRQFEELLHSGDVSNVLPQWQPWWLSREEKTLVEDVEFPKSNFELPCNCPNILLNIQPLSKLSKVSPSPYVRWNIVNVLAAYSVTARVYNGDHLSSPQEAATTLVSLSDNLSTNQVFEGPETAVAAVHLAAIKNDSIVTGVDEEQFKDDVQKLVEGPSNSLQSLYVLAALSDIHTIFSSTKRKIKDNINTKVKGEFSKRFPDTSVMSYKQFTASEINKHLKKIEFYLSWTKNCF